MIVQGKQEVYLAIVITNTVDGPNAILEFRIRRLLDLVIIIYTVYNVYIKLQCL